MNNRWKKRNFRKYRKKSNIVPVHKKEDKNLIKNYPLVSLLPIFSKIYERVIYNALFNYFKDNKLFTPSQSGFLPGDSCIAQLLSIIHEIQTAFDNNPAVDVRGVFLDFLTSQKPLIKSGTLPFYSNQKLMALMVSYFLCRKTILKNVNKEFFKCSDFWVEENKCWSSTRIGIGFSFAFNLHTWFAWRNNINM